MGVPKWETVKHGVPTRDKESCRPIDSISFSLGVQLSRHYACIIRAFQTTVYLIIVYQIVLYQTVLLYGTVVYQTVLLFQPSCCIKPSCCVKPSCVSNRLVSNYVAPNHVVSNHLVSNHLVCEYTYLCLEQEHVCEYPCLHLEHYGLTFVYLLYICVGVCIVGCRVFKLLEFVFMFMQWACFNYLSLFNYWTVFVSVEFVFD